ncbi:hypothetical protein G647_00285 [Cladophialophora carrionii CBS 160.54]|uniref:PPM-type phosphatase domain-containing protein n=1 Tax=Cladophialophora carrionii CBS 160.54 TaxID=1279043 RepID=V9DME9_9EURO|nr:uncharacterized protein G647_00285 [Cladophialophora carrionii CBS 160.54]ETI27836.1 hypothetical protein G647_00285 [Cladophialophora carrionii CBS 160.54]
MARNPPTMGGSEGSTANVAVRIVDIGVGQSQGTRDHQEDRFKILRPGEQFGRTIALFAVYDGHGGDSVSNFAEHHLHEILSHELQHQHGRDAFHKAITKSFQEVDRRLRQRGIGEATGSTVSLALVDVGKGTMVTADLGDSYAFLGVQRDEHPLEVLKLSQSQKPGEKSERERIEKAGGQVNDDFGGARIGGINLSRALGDLDYKKPGPDEKVADLKDPSHPLSNILKTDLAKATGLADANDHDMLADWISNIPHTNYQSLTGARRYILLLASDGLGEEKDGASSLWWAANQWDKGVEATHIARQLAEKSSRRTSDNSTVLIAVFE